MIDKSEKQGCAPREILLHSRALGPPGGSEDCTSYNLCLVSSCLMSQMEEVGGTSTSALTLDAFRLRIPRDAAQGREGQKEQEQEDGDLEACLAEEPAACTDGFFYIPNFITEDEERYLIEKVCVATESFSPDNHPLNKSITHRSIRPRFRNGRP